MRLERRESREWMASLGPREKEETQVCAAEEIALHQLNCLPINRCRVVCYITEHPPHFILASLSAGLPGRGYPGPPGTLGIKGWSRSIIYPCNPSVTEQTKFQWITFFSSPQVTKAVWVCLALQVIQVFLVSKVTRDFQVYRDAMASQERGGSQAFL